MTPYLPLFNCVDYISYKQRDAGAKARTEFSAKESLVHSSKPKSFHSCHFCGKIHAEGQICSHKPTKRKKIDEAVQFRNSAAWHKKRQQIKQRDCYLCQICVRELYGTRRKYNYKDLQVHHAVPINSREELRLDDSNLITLCSTHHAMCDKGEIPLEEVKKIILEQENHK